VKFPKIFFVLPCFNEENVLPQTSKILFEKISSLIEEGKISKDSKIVFVDDGSTDKSWEIIKKLSKENECFEGLKLSCNKGHQNAILAGLMSCKDLADAVISLDIDLQHNIEAFDEMLNCFSQGYDIVHCVRNNNASKSFIKQIFSFLFYKFMFFIGVDLIYNSADYRLMSKKALNGLDKYKEVNLFLRGVVQTIGYKNCTVKYDENERTGGESKYNFKSQISLALSAMTSFTIKPIRLITLAGIVIVVINALVLLYVLISFFDYRGRYTYGWGSLLSSVWFLGGLQLIAIGVIGEYLGRMYLETKNRPRYLIEESTFTSPSLQITKFTSYHSRLFSLKNISKINVSTVCLNAELCNEWFNSGFIYCCSYT
jgi:glycosyltransferase involved in cell wall biosynthesis